MTLTIDQFTHVKERKTLVAEASDLGLTGWPKELSIQSHSGKAVNFIFNKFDMCGSEEEQEIAGAVYKSLNPEIWKGEVLIIND